jgi:ribulose-5-phosphate 4-epimerase/fuculose-1-phosphate aldolase
MALALRTHGLPPVLATGVARTDLQPRHRPHPRLRPFLINPFGLIYEEVTASNLVRIDL